MVEMTGEPDILTKVSFYTTEKGGRKNPIPASAFRCTLDFKGLTFNVRLCLERFGPIKPGDTATGVPIKFLWPKLLLSQLSVGEKFRLWESGVMAEGEITEVLVDPVRRRGV